MNFAIDDRPRAAWLLPAVLLLALAGAARGQGTTGTLPDPITTDELMGYARRLALSGPQRLALEAVHDDYKRRFRVLREGKIESFLDEMRSLQSAGLPQRDVVEDFLKHLGALRGEIATLDRRLFDGIQPLLTDEQAAGLPRVRLARERRRYQTEVQLGLAGSSVDLTELVRKLDLSPAARAAADPLLESYERRQTAGLRELSRQTSRTMLDLFEALAARGFGELTAEQMTDPETMQQLMEAMREVYAAVTARIRKLETNLRALNTTTYRNLVALLPAAPARHLRTAFYRAAYPELLSINRLETDNLLARAAALDDPALIDEATAAILADLAGGYEDQLERLLRQGAELVDRHRAEASPFDFGQNSDDYNQALARLAAQANDLVQRTASALEGHLGAAKVAQIREAAAPGAPASAGSIPDSAVNAPTVPAAATLAPLLPPPIDGAAMTAWGQEAGLDQATGEVLQELHRGYRQRYQAIEPLRALGEPDATAPAARLDLRRRALAAIQAADDAFFDDLGTALAGHPAAAGLPDLRRRRRRQTLMGAAAFGGLQAASGGGSVDLAAVLDEAALTPAAMAAVAPIMKTYDGQMLAALEARYDAQLEVQRVFEEWMDANRRREDGQAAMNAALDFRRRVEPALARAKASGDTVAEINRTTLESACAALPDRGARMLRTAFDRRAFPEVFRDPAAMDRAIGGALDADDLSPGQREALGDLAATYRPEYERLSQKMIDLSARGGGVAIWSLDPEQMQQRQQAREKMARVRFDRDELNARAKNRLKTILHEDQLARLGLPPDG